MKTSNLKGFGRSLLSRVRLIMFCEQCDGKTCLARSSCTTDTVHVIFNCERELEATLAYLLAREWEHGTYGQNVLYS